MAKPITYKTVQEIRRLHAKGLSLRVIAGLTFVDKDTVMRYTCRGCMYETDEHNAKCGIVRWKRHAERKRTK